MYIKHKIYATIFNVFRKFIQKKNKVTFLTNKNHSFDSNLEYIANELSNKKNKNSQDYEYNFIEKDSLSLKNIAYLASSKYVFLVDNFFPLAFMNVDGMKLVQLWHGTGLFKKFGYDFLNDKEKKVMEMFKDKINLISVSNENAIDIYANNFHINKSKIKPFGVPSNDFYNEEHLNNNYLNELRNSFKKNYPQIKNKKLVLYAPTFRENAKNNNVFNHFNIKRFIDELGDEYILAIRLHPNYKKYCDEKHSIDLKDLAIKHNFLDFTGYKNKQKLLLLSDILITDYSSIMVDYTILNKPIVLFAYDLDEYINKERGFYFDYKENVPGKIVYNMDELIKTIKDNDFKLNNVKKFFEFQFGNFKTNSSKLILDYILDE